MEIADKSKKICEFKLGKKNKVSEDSRYLFSTFFFFFRKIRNFKSIIFVNLCFEGRCYSTNKQLKLLCKFGKCTL